MNSSIAKTDLQDNVKKFQQSRKLHNKEFDYGKVGSGWQHGFLRRNGDKFVTKRGEKFAVDRSDWTTFKNMEQMYDIIYDEMVAAKVAEKLPQPIYCDREGNKAEN